MTDADRKAEAWRLTKAEVNPPKRELMRIVSDLRSAGMNRKANGLERLVREIEDWQHR